MSESARAGEEWARGLPLKAGDFFLGIYQPSPETVGFWEGVRRRELLLKWCPACRKCFHPKRIVCTDCGMGQLEWRASEGAGEVYSCSEVHRAAHPAFAAAVPYTVGIVRLAETVYLFSRLIAERVPVRIGVAARLDFRVLETGHLLPVFLT
jgi:uncharacterized OB-fold protein